MATWINFRQLREHLKFDEVLKYYDVEPNLKKHDQQHQGICPLPNHHQENSKPTFSANLPKKIWQCFGCGGKGNILDFAVLMEGLDPKNGDHFRIVAHKLEMEFAFSQAKPTRKSEKNLPASNQRVLINEPLDFELKTLDPLHPYFKTRGIRPETVEHFGLGFCSRGFLKHRIAIPIHNENDLVGYVGLLADERVSNETPRYLFPTTRVRKDQTLEFQKDLLLYHGHSVENPVDDIVVVRDFMDVWKLWQEGWKSVVGLMNGKCSESQVESITTRVNSNGRIWILQNHADVPSKIVTSRFCRVIQIPKDQHLFDLHWKDIAVALI